MLGQLSGPHRKFVVVESSESGALLLSRTLKRKFPQAEVVPCTSAVALFELAADRAFDLFVVHRVEGEDAASLARRIKEAQPEAPVIVISSTDRQEDARASGADAFLLFDEWLMLGTVAERLLSARTTKTG